ncbi:hypothetical protein FHR83_007150 [Actinoplanes campanulatus]|uniref:Tat (Twin-arginine translocation) pathway signal sequence n=1 Tax=Actinoplanes campanulatus TaxID=113559 RepID=A0A7W5FI77_9ACTN|nr:twin-arginine translocation signal domain-containing protein [Actinoplanes campanulatus]MBB3099443.1 hypothetical protein [Actinoplanes campanulatus]GGN42830.1 hypothetical protein GCM10010109_74380 [Actinoplanes campanulatus]GID39791.1 hypothetical protein Aca09nite_62970 [Actinoplanes campanulatus]
MNVSRRSLLKAAGAAGATGLAAVPGLVPMPAVAAAASFTGPSTGSFIGW